MRTTAFSRIKNYVDLVAPEPEILRLVGEAAVRKGSSKLISRQIAKIIRATRADRKKKQR